MKLLSVLVPGAVLVVLVHPMASQGPGVADVAGAADVSFSGERR